MTTSLERAIRDIVQQEVTKAKEQLQAEFHISQDRDLSFSEACEHLHMSEYTLRQLIKAKKIPHRVYGTPGSKNPRYIFSQHRLDQWKREEEERNYVRETS